MGGLSYPPSGGEGWRFSTLIDLFSLEGCMLAEAPLLRQGLSG